MEVRESGPAYWTSGWSPKDLSFLKEHAAIVENVPVGTALYCELWKPDTHATSMATVIAERDPSARLDVFAVDNGSIVPKYALLEAVHLQCQQWGLHFIEFEQGMRGDHEIMEHAEGWVYKNGNLCENFKRKPFKDVTLKVTGVEMGKGKFAGLIGSLEVAMFDGTVVANVSGMDDKEREMLTQLHLSGQLKRLLVDVSYQKANSKGKLRHANFVRVRLDKLHADKELP